MFGALQAGSPVTLDNGRIVEPREILGPERAGKSVAYCLDTRPCASSVELARGVDLLIHEATYTNDLTEEAQQYGHSTAAQAARTALEAGARRLLITHFSTRYPDAGPLLDEAREVFAETILAHELAEVTV